MSVFERVLLWFLIVVVFYQNGSILSEDEASGIASDSCVDVLADGEYVTDTNLINRGYLVAEDVNEVFERVGDRLDDIDKSVLDLDVRILELELKEIDNG